MSKICLKYNCPNRISIGREDDNDTISIICPKCERLLFVSEKRTKKFRSIRNWSFGFILLSIFIYLTYSNIGSFISHTPVQIDNRIENIKSLLKAEDERNFDKIRNFFTDEIRRYWNCNYINKDSLKILYLNSWKKTSYSKNEVKKIVKKSDNIYILHTHFVYFLLKKGKELEKNSKVKFVFDKNNKIVEAYGMD